MYWCFDCGSSLAEFEIEYADRKTSPTIDVGFHVAEPRQGRRCVRPAQACRQTTCFAVIWTTTPWTIPANQALNLNPELDYALVDTERGAAASWPPTLVEACLRALRPRRQACSPPPKGEALGGLEFHHPLYDVDPGYERLSPVYLADYATAEDGTGIVHSSPAYGVDDFNSCMAHGMKYDEILNPVQGNGAYARDLPLFGGMNIWKAAPPIIDDAARSRRAVRHRDARRTAIRIAGATRRR